MAKKVSKWFRIGVEGDTCDGRVISADDIQEMADTFDPRVYGCRINLEHIRGLLPDSLFKRYGDVVELKAEVISDGSALDGKKALFGKIQPLDELVSMVKAGHIRQSMRDILVTPVGSRVMRREYGSLLSALIDQPQTPALRLQIMAACYSAIQKWEPRVRLTTITFERSETDGGLYVDITGTRSANGQPFSLTIPLS